MLLYMSLNELEREQVHAVHATGLYAECVHIVELAAKHAGVAPDAELSYDVIGCACRIVGKALQHIPPASSELTEQLARQLLHLVEWKHVPTVGLARAGYYVQAFAAGAAAVLVGSREGDGDDVALSEVRQLFVRVEPYGENGN